MLKKVIPILSLFIITNLYADESLENPSFETVMHNAVAEAQVKMESLQSALTEDQHSPELQKEYKNAVRMLQLKKELLNNFSGTASLNDPLVRDILLFLLKKDKISSSDIAQLQNVVNAEKVIENP